MISFSEVLADVGNHGKYSLSLYDMGRFMRLDAAAQRALNVMKTKFDANDNFSLYGLMSRARTSMGKRLLKASLAALSQGNKNNTTQNKKKTKEKRSKSHFGVKLTRSLVEYWAAKKLCHTANLAVRVGASCTHSLCT